MAAKVNNIVLFDMARTRSHLFYRYLNTHPDIEALWHPYTPAYLFGPERVVDFTTGSATLQSFEKYTFKEAGNVHANALKEANSKVCALPEKAVQRWLTLSSGQSLHCKRTLPRHLPEIYSRSLSLQSTRRTRASRKSNLHPRRCICNSYSRLRDSQSRLLRSVGARGQLEQRHWYNTRQQPRLETDD